LPVYGRGVVEVGAVGTGGVLVAAEGTGGATRAELVEDGGGNPVDPEIPVAEPEAACELRHHR
jgi:hypothetical protein